MLGNKVEKSMLTKKPGLDSMPKFKRESTFYIIVAIITAFILVLIISFFMVPIMDISYHAFTDDGGVMTVSFKYTNYEFMTDSNTILEFMTMITQDSPAGHSGLPIFVAWLLTLAILFCIAVLVRFLYLLFTDVGNSIDPANFSIITLTVLSVVIVGVAIFVSVGDFVEFPRILGVGASLSDAYDYKITLFPFLIVQYIIFIAALITKFIFIRKLNVNVSLYLEQLREQKQRKSNHNVNI